MRGTRPSVAVALLVSVAVAGAAHAQDAAQQAAADRLFNEGKAAMTAKDYETACKKFEGSHDVAPSAAALMNLADCFERRKMLASAQGWFLEAARFARSRPVDAALEKPARARASALEARVSTLTIVVPDGNRVEGLTILRNGEPIVAALWNGEIPVDGGEHEIIARAPGTVAWRATVSVATELDRRELQIPRLAGDAGRKPDQPPPPDEPPAPRIVTGAAGGDRADDSGPSRFTTMRKAAVGATAVGVVALGAGIALGLQAQGKQADSDAICPTTTCDDPEGLQLNADARAIGKNATILFAVGGVAVAGGVVLWLVGAPERPASVAMTPLLGGGTVGLSLGGGF